MTTIEFSAEPADPLQRRGAALMREPRFMIGRSRHSGWIVDDRLGLVGGIFVNEAAARHFAFEESGGQLDQIRVVAESGYLDILISKVA